ncbi:hypothetical protein FG93_05511 [Bosea sp. LC85]|uniref:hypothetical protein n=1 Tax=Bosea sp. LC85 TaxID=1502851 RepID=UPI0004E307C2|nr:hypothetical protein [Bosea sp. LC85]KFC64001.1 hypothetical protein FG93_05511 [Bosea sp. LC85]
MDHQAKATAGETRQQRIARARSALGAALVQMAKAEKRVYDEAPAEGEGRGTEAGQSAPSGQ